MLPLFNVINLYLGVFLLVTWSILGKTLLFWLSLVFLNLVKKSEYSL